ncbi:ImmA/IrrE family metallo-endopeptidase [Halomonas sp. DQ26W]|uniref:ImmA/IrrE family metallo-endopeptidase n=1 Tax=Halomonas sp. DQ26W TaxID=2282311 RepID=UPI000DF7D3D4|nr:ImmA/IrrE family metallo-endopeptidase [Halomonas sp. DQ26W]RDB42147.1 ImmA/IrrE family metallo-endopeptidase [Halomonas sp. DQ26W]
MAAELELIVDTAPSQGSLEHGWLKATLLLDGQPYWYGGDDQDNPLSLDWTWIDLLQYIGKNWSALMLEQSCPLPLDDVPHPGKLLQKAEARWEDMPEALVMAEENQMLQYLDRHNIATALSGANLPMLLWQRSGNTLWLVDEEEQARRVDFFSLRQRLETIGDTLAEVFSSSPQPHVKMAVSQWRRREQQLQDDYLAYSTGLDAKRLATLREMVKLEGASDTRQEPVYLAAARMTRHHLSVEQIAQVIQRLQQAPSTGKQPFSAFIDGASLQLQQMEDEPPFEQGYQLARWLREQLKLKDDKRFDPELLLVKENVAMDKIFLESAKIDAIACWGTIDPLILLNKNEEARVAKSYSQRSTLAHEVCHLLIDRDRALPVAEVLGGEVDSESEKRANAFAAELLLPQAHATSVYRTSPSLSEAVEKLVRTHQVSRQLVAYQLHNATDVMLNEDDRTALRNYGVRA